jgi:hypothetical protein
LLGYGEWYAAFAGYSKLTSPGMRKQGMQICRGQKGEGFAMQLMIRRTSQALLGLQVKEIKKQFESIKIMRQQPRLKTPQTVSAADLAK